MLRIRRLTNGQVVFKLSGRMDRDAIAQLETLIKLEGNGRPIILDLKDVTVVGQDGITFLERCEADSITLRNCAGYIREWITKQARRKLAQSIRTAVLTRSGVLFIAFSYTSSASKCGPPYETSNGRA